MKSKKLLKIKILIILILTCLSFKSTAISSSFSEEQTVNITKNLRCLICQGQSVYDSDSDFANSLKIVVQNKVSEGKAEKEIFISDNYYLLNIWSSWCIPCRDEHHFLTKLKKNEKIELIGLNYKDKEKNAKNFLNELSNPYKKILSDIDGTIAIEWGAYGVPESFLIKNNQIIKKVIGPLNEKLFSEIKELIQ